MRASPADGADADVEVDVLVVGAGQAGLGTGHWLARRAALSFVVVDGAERVGDSWRRRWDSLVLFTPRRFSSLPGTRMPRGPGEFASKDQMGDYLGAYAAREGLPVRLRTRVPRWATTWARMPPGKGCPSGSGPASSPWTKLRARPAVRSGGRHLERDRPAGGLLPGDEAGGAVAERRYSSEAPARPDGRAAPRWHLHACRRPRPDSSVEASRRRGVEASRRRGVGARCESAVPAGVPTSGDPQVVAPAELHEREQQLRDVGVDGIVTLWGEMVPLLARAQLGASTP